MPDAVVLLVEQAKVTGAHARPRLLGAPREPLAGHRDHAAVGLVEPRQARQERRLARARGPGHGDDLAGLELQRDAAQGEGLVVAGVEEAIEALRLEHRAHADHRRESLTRRHGSTLSAPLGPLSVRTTARPLWKKT